MAHYELSLSFALANMWQFFVEFLSVNSERSWQKRRREDRQTHCKT